MDPSPTSELGRTFQIRRKEFVCGVPKGMPYREMISAKTAYQISFGDSGIYWKYRDCVSPRSYATIDEQSDFEKRIGHAKVIFDKALDIMTCSYERLPPSSRRRVFDGIYNILRGEPRVSLDDSDTNFKFALWSYFMRCINYDESVSRDELIKRRVTPCIFTLMILSNLVLAEAAGQRNLQSNETDRTHKKSRMGPERPIRKIHKAYLSEYFGNPRIFHPDIVKFKPKWCWVLNGIVSGRNLHYGSPKCEEPLDDDLRIKIEMKYFDASLVRMQRQLRMKPPQEVSTAVGRSVPPVLVQPEPDDISVISAAIDDDWALKSWRSHVSEDEDKPYSPSPWLNNLFPPDPHAQFIVDEEESDPEFERAIRTYCQS